MTLARKIFLPALLFVFILSGVYVAQNTSPTIDEAIFHTVDGYVGLVTHDYRLNPVSPAFAREWVALPWLFVRPALDLSDRTWKEADSPEFGTKFFYRDNRGKAIELIFLARLMNILLGAGLVLVVFAWSYELYGFPGAVLSSALTAFTPSILAHSAIAATDLPVAFWSVFFLFSLWKWLREGGLHWFFLSALTLGLAQSSKFTALFLYPVLGILLWRERGLGQAIRFFILLLFLSLFTVWATYFFEFKPLLLNVPRSDEKLGMIAGISSKIFPGNAAMSARLQELALHRAIPLPSFILGIAGVVRGHKAPYSHYFQGVWTTQVQWFYYLLSFVVKMTPSFLVLLFLRVVAWPRIKVPKNLSRFLLLLPLVFFWITLKDSTAVGMRYLLVVIPLFAVWIGALTTVSFKPDKLWRGLLATLLSFHLLSLVQVFPYCLEYFNGLGGGTARAYHTFRGSDVDWGQGLVYLKKYLEQKGEKDPVVLDYFGSTDPAIYGIRYRLPLPGENQKPRRELYAVSSQHVDSMVWTAGREPDVKLGGSMFLYDLRKNPEAAAS